MVDGGGGISRMPPPMVNTEVQRNQKCSDDEACSMSQAECVPCSEDILSGAVKWPSHDGPMGIVLLNDIKLNKCAKKETVKRSKKKYGLN